MAAQRFLVKLEPYDVPNNIYTATVIDPNLGIWHDPIYPPRIWGPPDMPPGFWGGGMGPGVKPQPPFPSTGVPTHPIALPGDPWWGQDLRPEHPIVIPPEGEVPPDPPSGTGNLDCRWGYTEEKGWLLFCVYDPAGGGKPRPPSGVGGGKKK